LAGGLNRLGIPKKSVPNYETALKAGKFIVIANGTVEEATRARGLMHRTHPESLEAHLPVSSTAEAFLVGSIVWAQNQELSGFEIAAILVQWI